MCVCSELVQGAESSERAKGTSLCLVAMAFMTDEKRADARDDYCTQSSRRKGETEEVLTRRVLASSYTLVDGGRRPEDEVVDEAAVDIVEMILTVPSIRTAPATELRRS